MIVHFEFKSTFFSILDFMMTVMKLLIRLYTINFVREHFGMPIHLILDALYDILNLLTTFKNFRNAFKLIN